MSSVLAAPTVLTDTYCAKIVDNQPHGEGATNAAGKSPLETARERGAHEVVAMVEMADESDEGRRHTPFHTTVTLDRRLFSFLHSSPLLAVAHHGKGQAQRNAAIALGRLAKNAHCLQALRDNHGIEILARSGVAKT